MCQFTVHRNQANRCLKHSAGAGSVNPGAYLISPNFLLPMIGAPFANPRCSRAHHHVEVSVLTNHLELLMDEVHGGREEHHDPPRRLPGAHPACVLAREHDGDHGLPGPRVEHRDGVPPQRRLEHLHLVPPRAELPVGAARRRQRRRGREDGSLVVGHGGGGGVGRVRWWGGA
jgi:hypothetical protein